MIKFKTMLFSQAFLNKNSQEKTSCLFRFMEGCAGGFRLPAAVLDLTHRSTNISPLRGSAGFKPCIISYKWVTPALQSEQARWGSCRMKGSLHSAA